jgi:hypothetical protein
VFLHWPESGELRSDFSPRRFLLALDLAGCCSSVEEVHIIVPAYEM